MALPVVERAAIEQALKQFDQELRNSKGWIGWEENQAHRYAILWNDRLYPAKKVLSLATGIPVSEFSGGSQTNKYLQAHGFEVVELQHTTKEVVFEVGQIYDRQAEINGPFGGNAQSGISSSAQSPAIFLFTGESGEQYGYRDGYDELGVFSYTGEGQVGDMELTGGNRAILHHAADGRSLHLFKYLGKKKGKSKGQRYLGEFACADLSWHEGPDVNGDMRKVVVFHLVPVARMDEAGLEASADEPAPSSLEEARRLALQAIVAEESSKPGAAVRNIYKRSAQVKNYVLMRAAGQCESCRNEAPFNRKDGSPYLEPHHINRLSDGGLDHPRYIGAVCPACHREIHYGVDGETKNEKLRVYVEALEA